jgi:hypothetical protein
MQACVAWPALPPRLPLILSVLLVPAPCDVDILPAAASNSAAACLPACLPPLCLQLSWAFYLPLALVCPPEMYALHRGINTVYQVGGWCGWVGGRGRWLSQHLSPAPCLLCLLCLLC